jgi:hypothetical protein
MAAACRAAAPNAIVNRPGGGLCREAAAPQRETTLKLDIGEGHP